MDDITYFLSSVRFSYRVGAIIQNQNKILIMKDDDLPFYYLPGGRVKIEESSSDALRREIQEEMNAEIEAMELSIVNESWFFEDSTQERYHEICLYYRVKIPSQSHVFEKTSFEVYENAKRHSFFWISFDDLKTLPVFPIFLKNFDFRTHSGVAHVFENR